MRLSALIIAVILTIPALSQDPPKPGIEYKLLKDREGTWDITTKVGGKETKGTVTYKMELGGLWLVGDLESELPMGGKFSGRSFETFSPVKKKWVSVWVDSLATSPVNMEGTYDKDKKVMTMLGEGPGALGKTTRYRSLSKMIDDDTVEMAMYVGEDKQPTFTVVYKRKK